MSRDFRRDYPERPIAAVGLVIWNRDQVLLIRRGRPPRIGQWSLPGGAQELGETVEEAARREAMEEAGIEIGPLCLIEVVDSITRDERGEVAFHYTLLDYWAEWVNGEARAGGDVLDVRWVDPSYLDRYELWTETRRIIEIARRMRGG